MKKLYLLAIIIASQLSIAYAANPNSKDSDPLTFKLGNATAKIGGFINVTSGLYLDGAIGSSYDFPCGLIEMSPSAADEHRFIFDASGSRLFLNVNQMTEALGNVNVYVEAEFRGSGSTLSLRVATLSLKGFTMGQDWSLMTDHAASAPTIDLIGVGSRTFFRTPQIAYKYNVTENYSVGASLEYPIIKYDSRDIQPEVCAPDVVMYAQTKNELGHLKLAGVLRTMPYCKNNDENDILTKGGWGVQLSGSLKATKFLTLYGQGIYGKNICKFLTAISTSSYDLLQDLNGNRLSTPMYGASIGANVKLSEKLGFAASYSRSYTDITESYANIDDAYESGTYISTALFYYPASKLTTGIEYLYGDRNNYDGTKGEAQRINLLARYFF